MVFHGQIHNGIIILDEAPSIPEGSQVRVEVLDAPQREGADGARRQGGQYAGRIWIAPDFDEWPDDLQEALGMKT